MEAPSSRGAQWSALLALQSRCALQLWKDHSRVGDPDGPGTSVYRKNRLSDRCIDGRLDRRTVSVEGNLRSQALRYTPIGHLVDPEWTQMRSSPGSSAGI